MQLLRWLCMQLLMISRSTLVNTEMSLSSIINAPTGLVDSCHCNGLIEDHADVCLTCPSFAGHAMFDFLVPVFNVLQLFQLYTPDFQLLLAEHQVFAPGGYSLLPHGGLYCDNPQCLHIT